MYGCDFCKIIIQKDTPFYTITAKRHLNFISNISYWDDTFISCDPCRNKHLMPHKVIERKGRIIKNSKSISVIDKESVPF